MGRMKCSGNRRIKNRLWYETYGPVPQVPCHWCQKLLTFKEATVDHEPPLAKGGHKFQAVIACEKCNQTRGKQLAETLRRERYST